jgi:hypothetical protein
MTYAHQSTLSKHVFTKHTLISSTEIALPNALPLPEAVSLPDAQTVSIGSTSRRSARIVKKKYEESVQSATPSAIVEATPIVTPRRKHSYSHNTPKGRKQGTPRKKLIPADVSANIEESTPTVSRERTTRKIHGKAIRDEELVIRYMGSVNYRKTPEYVSNLRGLSL